MDSVWKVMAEKYRKDVMYRLAINALTATGDKIANTVVAVALAQN